MTRQIPGPRQPALLQFLQWIRNPIAFMEHGQQRYGEPWMIRFPAYPPIVLFSHPTALKEIFAADPEVFRAGEASAVFGPVLGVHSPLLLDGSRHQHQRRLLLPTFHRDRIAAYCDAMTAVTERAICSWPIGPSFRVQHEMQSITMELLLLTVLGTSDANARRELKRCLASLLSMFSSTTALVALWCLQTDLGPLTPWHRLVRLRRAVDDAIYDEIARRRRETCTSGEDVLSIVVAARDQQGEPLSGAQIRDILVTLLIAGHETMAPALSWALYNVLSRPRVLASVRDELAHVVGSDALGAHHLARLEYLDAAIKETLRLNPTIITVGRRLARSATIAGVPLPEGVVVAPCIYLAHRRADAWPEPDSFEPHRFLGTRPSPYEFLPFGGGPRYCLGAEYSLHAMRLILAQVFLRLELRLREGYTARPVRRGTSFVPAGGVPVICRRRG